MKETKTRYNSLLVSYQRWLNGFTKLAMNADFRVEFANHVTISSFGYIQMALVDYKYYFHAVGMGILYKILEVYSTLLSLIWIFRSTNR